MNKYLEIFENKGKEAEEAFEEILSLQSGESDVIKTGIKFLDDNLIGGVNNCMIFVASRPSMGKTHNSSTIQRNLLENYEDVRILRMNLEMPTQSLLLRELRNSSKRKMKDILSRPFTDEELREAKISLNKFKDPRITDFSKALLGEELKDLLRAFHITVKKEEKELGRELKKVVFLDHIHTYSSKVDIDSVIEIFNDVKMVDKNMSFFIYAQLNRTIEDMWREAKEKKGFQVNMLPSSKYIYMSDKLMQYADIVMAITIPQVVDLEEFASVNRERNQHLSEHFIEDGKESKFAKLKGLNRVYYNFIKIRMNDDFDEPRLFCELIDEEKEEFIDMIYKESSESNKPTLTPPPTFDLTSQIQITPLTEYSSPSDAFGDDEDIPF